MRIDRAAKFGVAATVGLVPISAGAYWLSKPILASEIDDNTTVLLIAIGASVVAMTLLFALVGVFVDRKLAEEGIASSGGK